VRTRWMHAVLWTYACAHVAACTCHAFNTCKHTACTHPRYHILQIAPDRRPPVSYSFLPSPPRHPFPLPIMACTVSTGAIAAAAAGAGPSAPSWPPCGPEDDDAFRVGVCCYYSGCNARLKTYAGILQHVRSKHKAPAGEYNRIVSTRAALRVRRRRPLPRRVRAAFPTASLARANSCDRTDRCVLGPGSSDHTLNPDVGSMQSRSLRGSFVGLPS